MFFLKIKHWKLYKQWKDRKAGKSICDHKKGPGYYLPLDTLSPKIKNREEKWKMKSGKIMLVRLISYENYYDPSDMTKSSTWQFIGYIGEKPFAELTWQKYLEMHMK